MAKRNRYASALAKIAKKLATTKPTRVYGPLTDALCIVAAAGDVARARTLIAWMCGDRALPASTDPAHGPNMMLVDGLLAAAGDPVRDERVQRAERAARENLTTNLVPLPGPYPVAAWSTLPRSDPWRRINQWREIQQLAAPVRGQVAATEPAALAALIAYIDDWPPEEPGPGAGLELILAFDLALRHGHEHVVAGWIATQGHRLEKPSMLAWLMTLPAIARSAVAGQFRDLIGLSSDEIAVAVEAIEAALRQLPKPNSLNQ